MTVATVAVLAASAGLLGACTSDEPDAPTSPSTASASAEEPTPSQEASPSDGAVDVRGDWHDTAAQWVVHFKDDGTFTEDFQGLTDFRVGTYEVKGDTVRLIGDDGNTDEGKVDGESVVFELGTLTRM